MGVLLDCCREFRDFDIYRDINIDGGDSLTREDIAALNVDIAEGTIIGYATSPNKKAHDGVNGHGAYTAALKKFLTIPNITVDSMLARVGAEVVDMTKTNRKGQPQQPQQPHRDSCMNREDVCLFVSKSRRMQDRK